MGQSEIIKLTVRDSRVNVTCPSCGKKKKLDVGKFRDRKDHLKVRCTCLFIFAFKPVFPKVSADDSRNQGYFVNLSKGSQKNRMTIINTTSSGINFRLQGLYVPRKADKLRVEYSDPFSKKAIKRKGTVHRISGKTVSVFFTH